MDMMSHLFTLSGITEQFRYISHGVHQTIQLSPDAVRHNGMVASKGKLYVHDNYAVMHTGSVPVVGGVNVLVAMKSFIHTYTGWIVCWWFVSLLLSFLAMPDLCCFRRVTQVGHHHFWRSFVYNLSLVPRPALRLRCTYGLYAVHRPTHMDTPEATLPAQLT